MLCARLRGLCSSVRAGQRLTGFHQHCGFARRRQLLGTTLAPHCRATWVHSQAHDLCEKAQAPPGTEMAEAAMLQRLFQVLHPGSTLDADRAASFAQELRMAANSCEELAAAHENSNMVSSPAPDVQHAALLRSGAHGAELRQAPLFNGTAAQQTADAGQMLQPVLLQEKQIPSGGGVSNGVALPAAHPAPREAAARGCCLSSERNNAHTQGTSASVALPEAPGSADITAQEDPDPAAAAHTAATAVATGVRITAPATAQTSAEFVASAAAQTADRTVAADDATTASGGSDAAKEPKVSEKKRRKLLRNNVFRFDHYQTRMVVLRVMYIGWRYHGFPSQVCDVSHVMRTCQTCVDALMSVAFTDSINIHERLLVCLASHFLTWCCRDGR